MNALEWAAAGLGVANVALLVRRSLWNYPFALAMVSLYAIVFYRARLYSDTLLQGFFFVANVYGWQQWLAGRRDDGEVAVRTLSGRARIGWLAAILALTLGWGTLMHRLTDAAAPYWDASIAMGSVAAQILLAKRYVDNWPLWVAVDVAAIGLYAVKDLPLTAALYGLFLILACLGWREWARAAR
ncbi:MAG TPA: nicotinamide riboside transporter PnuC [Sphingomonas sp.]|jgi:nicotinamide mononucleotide transporter|nr:nicotinamide riboside transporter PnuC [Sphingomonas sp.]